MSRPSYSSEDDFMEDAVEFLPSHEGDLIYQLGEKIRSLAHKVTSLEHYKVLCERRIAELSPNHTLPLDLKTARLHRSDSYGPTPPVEEAKASLEGTAGVSELPEVGKEPRALVEAGELAELKRTLEDLQRAGNQQKKDQAKQTAQLTADLELANRRAEEAEKDCKAALSRLAQLELQGKTAPEVYALESALSQCKAEMSSMQSQKDFFQTAYNTAKQEAGAREAAEFRAKGEIRELQKALQVLWDGAASAARNAQAQEEQSLAEIKAVQKGRNELQLALEIERAKGKKDLEYCKNLESQVKNLEIALETAKSSSNKDKESIARLQSQVHTLETDLAAAHSQSAALGTRFTAQHTEGLMEEVQTLQLQQDRALEELQALRLQLRTAAEDSSDAESQLERLRKEANLREEQLSTALEDQRRCNGLLERIMRLLPGSEKTVVRELIEASEELATAEREQERLTRRLRQLEGGRGTEQASREVLAAEKEVSRERKRLGALEREVEALQLQRLHGNRSFHAGKTADPRIVAYPSDSPKQRIVSQRSPFVPKHLPNSLL